jgi:U3 small nucleolar RNA-associated protein 14
MMSADITVGQIGTVEHNYWFDKECEPVTMIKNEAYRRMQQKDHTRKAVEKHHVARREEKRVHKKRKKEYNKYELKELEHLMNINESRALYQKLNKS